MKFNKRKSKLLELSIAEFSSLQEIFAKKGWPIEECFDDKVFDNFCELLKQLDSEQRKLLISLTKDFLWVQESSYLPYFSKTFNIFVDSYDFYRGKNIYICPLLPEEDFGKSKSSVYLFYSVKSCLKVIQSKYNDFAITYSDMPKEVDLNLVKNNYTLCLIDDFIGTGETAESAVSYFLNQGIAKEKIVILALVGMKAGLSKLEKAGYQVYSNVLCDKGLSTKYDESQIAIMRDIEESIGVRADYRFGYGASEALVRMRRTPNNTFPIYWYRGKKNNFAPFPR